MATILEFRTRRGKHDPGANRAEEAPSEIVRFPGVRYERWSETGAAKPRAPRRRRDRLELED